MTVPVRVRRAVPADAGAAGEIFLACWHRSYAHLLRPEVRARYDEAGAVALWRRTLAAQPDGVLVADVTGCGVRGVTRFGTDPDDARRGHVFSLYVHPDAQGLGLGGALLRTATAELRTAAYDAATLWVFEANDTARAFYSAHGWVPDGGARLEEAYGEPEIRLRRKLAEAEDPAALSTRSEP